MAQVRLLVPWTDDDGKQHSPGDVVNVDDVTYEQLRADGKASSTAEEDAQAKQAKEGNYQARTGREDVASTKTEKAEEPKPEAKKK